MLEKVFVDKVVSEWEGSWKDGSVLRILALCSDSFVGLNSPFTGTLSGKESVQKHWECTLQQFVNNTGGLEVIDVLFCVDTISIYYRLDAVYRAMDLFKFDAENKVISINCMYSDNITKTDSSSTSPINKAFAMDYAKNWQEGWNSHDLSRVLSHYTEDFTMTTPFIARMAQNPTGTLRGKESVGSYWEKALQRFTDLHFELLDVLFGEDSVCVYYHSVLGLRAIEWLKFKLDGDSGPYLVSEASGSYNAMPL